MGAKTPARILPNHGVWSWRPRLGSAELRAKRPTRRGPVGALSAAGASIGPRNMCFSPTAWRRPMTRIGAAPPVADGLPAAIRSGIAANEPRTCDHRAIAAEWEETECRSAGRAIPRGVDLSVSR